MAAALPKMYTNRQERGGGAAAAAVAGDRKERMEKKPEREDAFTFHSRHYFKLPLHHHWSSVQQRAFVRLLNAVAREGFLLKVKEKEIFEARGHGPPRSPGPAVMSLSKIRPPALQIETVVGWPAEFGQPLETVNVCAIDG